MVAPQAEEAGGAAADPIEEAGPPITEVADTGPPSSGAAFDPSDSRTESISAGTVKLGWSQIDIGSEANYENPADAKNANTCPIPTP